MTNETKKQVRCVDLTETRHLTMGKVYFVYGEDKNSNYYFIKDDFGDLSFYHKSLFEIVDTEPTPTQKVLLEVLEHFTDTQSPAVLYEKRHELMELFDSIEHGSGAKWNQMLLDLNSDYKMYSETDRKEQNGVDKLEDERQSND